MVTPTATTIHRLLPRLPKLSRYKSVHTQGALDKLFAEFILFFTAKQLRIQDFPQVGAPTSKKLLFCNFFWPKTT